MAIIEVREVRKSFRIPSVRRETVREHLFGLLRPRSFERLTVLDSVSFGVEAGETLGIMGRNGSGKSTLLKIVCGIYRPNRGGVVVRGLVTPILELGIGWNPELDAVDNILQSGTVMGLSLVDTRRASTDLPSQTWSVSPVSRALQRNGARLAYSVAFTAAREILVLDESSPWGRRLQARCGTLPQRWAPQAAPW
jgi:ABC-type polysaccharide/polyol phosphate transport system ATPase subunit